MHALEVLLEEGPSTYSVSDLRDGVRLAQKIVASYGMTEAGITMYAPKQRPIGFMKRAFEVRPQPHPLHLYPCHVCVILLECQRRSVSVNASSMP